MIFLNLGIFFKNDEIKFENYLALETSRMIEYHKNGWIKKKNWKNKNRNEENPTSGALEVSGWNENCHRSSTG